MISLLFMVMFERITYILCLIQSLGCALCFIKRKLFLNTKEKNWKIAHKFPVFRSEVGEGFSVAMGPGRAGGRELWGRRRGGFLELWALGPPRALLLGPSY